MRNYQNKFIEHYLKIALKSPCPELIPRSGAGADNVNCFSVRIDKGTDPYLVVLAMNKNSLSCLQWDGNRFATKVESKITDHDQSEYAIKHYYGPSEIAYSGLVDLAIGRALRLPYIWIGIRRVLAQVDQHFFNKKKFYSKKRNDLLRLLVDRMLAGQEESSAMDIMTELYSIKWFSHPAGDIEHQKVKFYLESLVASGELSTDGYHFKVTNKAVSTLEIYEEQERKHTESIKLQRRMFVIATVVAALTFVQAGLIKLKPWYDQTN
jgi:hypothetical protein